MSLSRAAVRTLLVAFSATVAFSGPALANSVSYHAAIDPSEPRAESAWEAQTWAPVLDGYVFVTEDGEVKVLVTFTRGDAQGAGGSESTECAEVGRDGAKVSAGACMK